MPENRRILAHLGCHKTGTTSFQLWASDSRVALRKEANVAAYSWAEGTNAWDIALACTRLNRTHAGVHPYWCLREWRAEVRARVRAFVASTDHDVLVSAEGLSLLRYSDEVEQFAEFFDPLPIRAAVCLRDPASWLHSYSSQLARMGERPSSYYSSHAYLERDTWLTDWEHMMSVWRGVLGQDAVTSYSYEQSVQRHGSTIPATLHALGVSSASLPPWAGYVENRSAGSIRPRLRQRLARRTTRALGSLATTVERRYGI